ncbi:MAG: alpha-amylase family glycosyl hydrolase [Verrucomicrobia bacterium]|nr:alpha-amylase family glycosyl hydrolase [Verrucomicrobiota bacterium]
MVLVLFLGLPSWGATPVVERIEPPGWWIGHTHNPVRVLITGGHLAAARVEAPAGIGVSNVMVSDNGQYLFADLTIDSGAKAGEAALRVSTGEGTATVRFELMEPLGPAGRGFTTDDVIYLLLPDRFANGDPANDDPAVSPGLMDRARPRHYHGGDFKGITSRLSYLRDLGVTALWLTPWYDNANQLNHVEKYTGRNQLSPDGVPSTDYHGYGAVDFYGVEEHFGTLEDLRELVGAVRRSGLKLVQDQVANHTGPYHPWVTNPPTPTWFNGSMEAHLDNSWQTWTVAQTNPPADLLQSTLEGWFLNILPDLNQNDPEVGTYLIQNSLWWTGQLGIDAIRQDTLPYVPRTYWARWSAALKAQHPGVTLLGEMFDGNPELVAFFQGGRRQFDGVDSGVETLFDFPLYYAIRDVFLKDQPMTRLSETLAADTNYVNARVLVTFLGLHDTGRFLTEPGASSEELQQAFTFLLTSRGTPLIYYGDEIGMNGGGDPYNRRDFPGGWAEDAQNAFEVTDRTPEQASMFQHVKKLIALRRQWTALRHGTQEMLLADADACAYQRVTEDAGVVVAINRASEPRELRLELKHPIWSTDMILTDQLGALGEVRLAGGTLTLRMPPGGCSLLTPGFAVARSNP